MNELNKLFSLDISVCYFGTSVCLCYRTFRTLLTWVLYFTILSLFNTNVNENISFFVLFFFTKHVNRMKSLQVCLFSALLVIGCYSNPLPADEPVVASTPAVSEVVPEQKSVDPVPDVAKSVDVAPVDSAAVPAEVPAAVLPSGE